MTIFLGTYQKSGIVKNCKSSDSNKAIASRLADLANLTPEQAEKLRRWQYLHMGYDTNGKQEFCVIDVAWDSVPFPSEEIIDVEEDIAVIMPPNKTYKVNIKVNKT